MPDRVWPYWALSMWRGLIKLKPTKDQIVSEVIREHGLSSEAFRNPGKHPVRPISYARQHAMAIMHAEGHSLASIGRYLKRDHSTIIAGINSHYKRAPADA